MLNVYLCKPAFKDVFRKVPNDLKHNIHKWSFGTILIDHIEPDGNTAVQHHHDYVILKIF